MAKQVVRSRRSVEDRSREICLIAARLIREKGFDATSMNDIAQAVSLTKAGLYYYTTGKHDLLYRIIDLAMTIVETEIVRPCLEIDDPLERIERIVLNHALQVCQEDVGALAILTSETNCLPEVERREIIARKRVYLDVVRGTLCELRDQGRLRDLDPTIAALNLFSTLLGIGRWYSAGGTLDAEQVAKEVCKFALRGLIVE